METILDQEKLEETIKYNGCEFVILARAIILL
jgi:hypothetical protein